MYRYNVLSDASAERREANVVRDLTTCSDRVSSPEPSPTFGLDFFVLVALAFFVAFAGLLNLAPRDRDVERERDFDRGGMIDKKNC